MSRGQGVVAVWCVLAAVPVSAQTTSSQQSADKLDAVIRRLVAETSDPDILSQHDGWQRPHRVMASWDADMGQAALQRIGESFTGDDAADVYVRWHLMYPINLMLGRRFEAFRHEGKHEASGDVVRKLFPVFDMIPLDRRPWADPKSTEARAAQDRLDELYELTRVRVGIPPFERTYSGEAALPHMKPQQRRAAQPHIEEIQTIKRTLAGDDMQTVEGNAVSNRLSDYGRDLRGELVRAMLLSGDPEAPSVVMREVAHQLDARQRAAFDEMDYVYLAGREGCFALYDTRTLNESRRLLNRMTRQYAAVFTPLRGDKQVPSYIAPPRRSFADLAFHLSMLLDEPAMNQQLLADPAGGAETPRAEPSKKQFTAENITADDVRAAIARAVGALHDPPGGSVGNRILPRERVRGDGKWYQVHRFRRGSPEFQETVNEVGNQALVCWAMLNAGESYQDPRLLRRIHYVLGFDTPYVYDRGMRAMMLGELTLETWRPWLERDATWLTHAVTDMGGFGEAFYEGEPAVGWGEHASAQYGVLGLWAAQRAGVDVPGKVWALIDRHWRMTQQRAPGGEPAGWSLAVYETEPTDAEPPSIAEGDVSAAMTAGGVATLVLTERYLRGDAMTRPDPDNTSAELQAGLAWLDRYFDMRDDDAIADWHYTMWTIQRVGQATGYRTFNGIDWQRAITAEMLNRQGPTGLWQDRHNRHGTLLSTGFALLYLGSALDPLAVAKLRFDGRWDNRPHDMWNFADYVSDRYEVETTWQVVDADLPVRQLIESPLLYVATDKELVLSDAQVALLRAYVDAGGMLVCNPESTSGGVIQSFRELAKQMYPELVMQRVEKTHRFSDLYTLREQVPGAVRMEMIDNGIRPLVVVFGRDVGKGLQANQIGTSGSFAAMANLYLFAVGLDPQRARMETNYVVPPDGGDRRAVSAARVVYHGRYDPEPAALSQLSAILARDHGVDLKVVHKHPEALTDDRIAFLSTTGEGGLNDEQAASIRAYVENGGTLWLDAAGGDSGAVDAAFMMLRQIIPDARPVPLPDDSPIITGEGLPGGIDVDRIAYRRFTLETMGPMSGCRLQGVEVNGRPAIIFSTEDLTTGLAGLEHWGIFGYSVNTARNLVVNGVLSTLEPAD